MPPLTYARRLLRREPDVKPPSYGSDNVHPTCRRCDVEKLLHDGILTEPLRSALTYSLEVVR